MSYRPTTNAPTTYAQWRRIYHEHLKGLGYIANSYFRAKRTGICPRPIMDVMVRSVQSKVSRLARIEAHLDELARSNDPSFLESVLDSVMQ